VKYIPLVYEVLLDHLILIQPIKTFPLLWKGLANHRPPQTPVIWSCIKGINCS